VDSLRQQDLARFCPEMDVESFSLVCLSLPISHEQSYRSYSHQTNCSNYEPLPHPNLTF